MGRSITTAALAGAVALLAASSAFAQSKTLTVAAYGGSWEQTLRKEMIPAFEQKHGVRVEYVAGNSTDTLAKLQAQKANQVIDVAIVDDGPMYQAIQLGFCGKIEGLDKSQLYPAALFKDDRAVAVGQTGTGFMINTKTFKDKGWATPTSWNDLKDPKFKKLLVIPPINNTYGLYTLMMFARMNGGGEKNIEPGFKVMKADVNPNVLVYEPSPGKMTELFQSNQAQIAVWGTGRVQAFANTGFPVDFIYPKEGAPILLASACPVAKANVNPLAHEFIKTLISAPVQTVLAKEMGNGPVNTKVDVNMPELRMAPVGERAKLIISPDWDVINAQREDWTKRWNREVSGDVLVLSPLGGGSEGWRNPSPNLSLAEEERERHTRWLPVPGRAEQRFGPTAVDGLTLAVEKGEFVSLLGPSGCGKTTTLQMIAGFVEPSGGAIRLEGRDLLAIKPAKRGLGIVFQSYALFPHMTVTENVAFGLEMQGVAAAERTQARRRDAGAGRPRRVRRPLPAPAVGRPAAARGAGPSAGHPAADPAARRAAQQPRRQAARGDADRTAPDPAHRRHHDHPGDARSGRGDGAQRPAGGDEPRPRRADRPAARGLRAAGHAVRRELPRPHQSRERRYGAAREDLVRRVGSRRQGAHAHLPGQPLALPGRDRRRPGDRHPPEHRRGDAGRR